MIVKPENMDFSNKNIIMIIKRFAGRWKTTPLRYLPRMWCLIDADEGNGEGKPGTQKRRKYL